MTDMNEWDYDEHNNYWIHKTTNVINLKHPKYVNECNECYKHIMEDDIYTIIKIYDDNNYYCKKCNDKRIMLEEMLAEFSKTYVKTKEDEKREKQQNKETIAKYKKYEAEEAKAIKSGDKACKERLKQKDINDAEYNAKYGI